jgi:hypothetical protein
LAVEVLVAIGTHPFGVAIAMGNSITRIKVRNNPRKNIARNNRTTSGRMVTETMSVLLAGALEAQRGAKLLLLESGVRWRL